MDRDNVLRITLWASAVFNLGGALLFAFPSSPLGQLAGMPVPVPAIYSAILAFFVLLFGGTYAWLAYQSVINRPLLALGAIGKTGVFGLIFVFWLLGEAPVRGVMAAVGDLVFALIWGWWLIGSAARPARETT